MRKPFMKSTLVVLSVKMAAVTDKLIRSICHPNSTAEFSLRIAIYDLFNHLEDMIDVMKKDEAAAKEGRKNGG